MARYPEGAYRSRPARDGIEFIRRQKYLAPSPEQGTQMDEHRSNSVPWRGIVPKLYRMNLVKGMLLVVAHCR